MQCPSCGAFQYHYKNCESPLPLPILPLGHQPPEPMPKSRRVIITIEAETDLPLADLRGVQVVELADCNGSMDLLMRYPADDLGPQPNRIVQVQVNAIKPEPKPKLSKADREWGDAVIADAAERPKRMAKRAKGAK